MSYTQLYSANPTFRGGLAPLVVGVVGRSGRWRPRAPPLSAVRVHMASLLRAVEALRGETRSLLASIENIPPEVWEAALLRLTSGRAALAAQLSSLTDAYLEGAQRALRRSAARRARRRRVRGERRQRREGDQRRGEEAEARRERERKKEEEKGQHTPPKVERSELSVSRRWCERLKLVRILTRVRTLNRDPDRTYSNAHLDKLISLWSCKLSRLEEEERRRGGGAGEGEEERWRGALFGGGAPQREFNNVQEFLHNRASWDVYVSGSGTAPPPGWVAPPPGWVAPPPPEPADVTHQPVTSTSHGGVTSRTNQSRQLHTGE